MRSMNKFLIDIVERVVTTFLAAFLPALVAAGPADLISLSAWQSAALAGVAAAVSLLKGLVASGVGNRSSASLTKTV